MKVSPRLRASLFATAAAILALLSGEAAAQSVLATIAAGTEPRAVAVNTATNRIYVANEFSNDVTVVDGATRTTQRVPVGRRPQYIAVNTRTNKVYVSNAQDASLSVIDGNTLAVATYGVNGSGPFLVDEASNRIYMVRLGNADEVTYFNGNDNTWYTIATDSWSPVAVALNPNTRRLYVAHYVSGDVRAVDTTSASDFPPTVSIGVWSKPTDIALNASTNKIYVVTEDPRGPIAVIDGNTNAATFLTAGGHMSGGRSVVVNPNTNKVYAGFSNEVAVLDGAGNALSFLATGPLVKLALNLTANKVFAISSGGAVNIIDGATNAIVPLAIPPGARDIAVDPFTNRAYIVGPAGVTIVQGDGPAGPPPPPPTPVQPTYGINVQGMWWAGGSESGWGVDIAHQGNTLFATWFTYDADGQPMWLVMSNGFRNGENAYTGDLYRMEGPPMNAPFDATKVKQTKVGAASFSFEDANTGNFTAQVNGASFGRKITRFQFGPTVSTCTTGGAQAATSNFQDLWWRSPANSESGWGIFLTHQGDTLMLAWFTYGADGRGTWLVASNVGKTGNATYTGTLYRTVGPPFNTSPWDPSRVRTTPAGSVTLVFNDDSNATLTYVLDTQPGSKSLTRFDFSTPRAVCR